ncbi:malonate decarboxylase beta subunit [Sphingomonas sp. PP-F2F-A104-K0414]|uniref:biotin-independent malonate decarboxylase subunit beta n=1 Tax=Sphingomonas sp. PP-F2F-A104-K0414 TaxID=2135661 RepID=UPI00104CCD86|nr:biotin-independent malonate decarboxylase subunit beta [Sphingomonas sp. PP-F2F-A104-K0414]TCQ00943.1 malonate decarboxylase beta subunit [Sphingomonas sp. PP-F2F-A104-K0414]
MSNFRQSWYEAGARERIAALVDTGSFAEFVGPERRETSPHLGIFDLPAQFDDGIVVGSATFDGTAILVAAQEGRFMGGAFGEVHGAKLTGLLRAAKALGRDVVIAFDTGGVRLQEANAGEIAIAEIMRAVVYARIAGVRVVGLIGGRAGCYGGGGLIAGCCSTLIVSEQGRISVTGPEVIETNMGVEEFDSRDRALVWRTMGGKHRTLIGGADVFVDDDAAAFRDAALAALAPAARPLSDRSASPDPFALSEVEGLGSIDGASTSLSTNGGRRRPNLDLDTLTAEQARLERRIARFGDAADATDIWCTLGIDNPKAIPDMPATAFVTLAAQYRESADDAR